ncbi:hypothetical protein GCM10022415_13410 [Knoellia locipacati]|uniref:Uncharacterized protein n=1 Tax=Knoellia locipacati TaxID=882824 RepID=A0A512SZB2_9MICO|nr:hypothetical protein [Knoellia locipacati]GEQ13291.1 hypothetical protein KLO01_13380 [Knoellia locipacati]
MTIKEGHFQLYANLAPALPAGDYRFTTEQDLDATGPKGRLDPGALPVDDLRTHVRVTSPRFQLPPDQVLSTYPPANTEGAYGSRLPQVVIKRRTLPWERTVDPENETDIDRPETPWLALVVIAENEAQLVLNQPVAECVTPGQVLPGTPDVAQGNYLQVRRSVVDRVLPTQKDVALLAHAREVDIHDTELMMGDDDGFLAVVIANRLPLPGRDAAGKEVPVTYLCALLNLEGQFDVLRRESPPQRTHTVWPVHEMAELVLDAAESDHVVMGTLKADDIWAGNVAHALGTQANVHAGPHADSVDDPQADSVDAMRPIRRATVAKESRTVTPQLREGWATGTAAATDSVYDVMAKPFGRIKESVKHIQLEPEYRFPVLLHWSFTSVGDVTFEGLMDHLDSGLLGTLPPEETTPANPLRTPGRTPGLLPLEVVETGHVGIDQRTRRGDTVRAWYRGPLLPHPADTAADRLPLAHTADQLRAVVPDRREDLSLAVAFEIGRLLALNAPATVSALLAWRQTHYQAARREALWAKALDGLELQGLKVRPERALGILLGRGLARGLAATPATVLGDPLAPVTRGTTMRLDSLEGAGLARTLAGGFAIDADLSAPLVDLARILRDAPMPRVDLRDLPGREAKDLTRGALRLELDLATGLLAVDALGLPAQLNPVLGAGAFGPIERVDHVDRVGGGIGRGGPGRAGPGRAGPGRAGPGPRRAPDALDAALDELED